MLTFNSRASFAWIRHVGAMASDSDDGLVAKVREVLAISDALLLHSTSIHLNQALVTLDGRGDEGSALDRNVTPVGHV